MEVVASGQIWGGFRWTEPVGFANNSDIWKERQIKGHS